MSLVAAMRYSPTHPAAPVDAGEPGCGSTTQTPTAPFACCTSSWISAYSSALFSSAVRFPVWLLYARYSSGAAARPGTQGQQAAVDQVHAGGVPDHLDDLRPQRLELRLVGAGLLAADQRAIQDERHDRRRSQPGRAIRAHATLPRALKPP